MRARGPQTKDESIKVHCASFVLHCHPLDECSTEHWQMFDMQTGQARCGVDVE